MRKFINFLRAADWLIMILLGVGTGFLLYFYEWFQIFVSCLLISIVLIVIIWSIKDRYEEYNAQDERRKR